MNINTPNPASCEESQGGEFLRGQLAPRILIACIVVLILFGAGIFTSVLIAAAVVLCATCLCVSCAGRDSLSAAGAAALAFVLLIGVTVVPLPSFLEHLSSRLVQTQNEMARDAIAQCQKISLCDSFSPAFSLSRDRAGTMRILVLLAAGLAAGFLSSRIPDRLKEEYLKKAVFVVLLTGIAGFVSQWILPQGKTLWWFFQVSYGDPAGCFINRNHFGGFIALICPACLALAVSRTGSRNLPAVLWVLAFAASVGIVIASLSRGAWIACIVSLLFTGLLAVRKRPVLAVSMAAIPLLAMIALAVAIPRTELGERLAMASSMHESDSARTRIGAWKDSMGIIRDYPVFGTGANAFRMVFPQYRSDTMRKGLQHAENEYIQVPVETGIAGVICIVFLVATAALSCRRKIASGTLDFAVTAGVGGAVAAAATHACFDFALRSPLYFMTLMSLAGLVTGSARRISTAGKKPFLLPGLFAAAAVLLIVALFNEKKLRNYDSPDFITQAGTPALCRALEWSPVSWEIWYHAGRQILLSGPRKFNALGERFITQAACYDPNNYRLWYQLAQLRLAMNDTSGALSAYRRARELRPWLEIEPLEKMRLRE